MIPDKYNMAYRHAHIVRSIGEHTDDEEDILVLLNFAVKNGLSSLRGLGCNTIESQTLLVDALRYQLASREATHPKCREVLHMGLYLLGHQA